MKTQRISDEQIMDYLDGALSPTEKARFEEHLKNSPEDAALVRELQFALAATVDVREGEPIEASPNFWPQLREKLGPAPKRGLLSSLQKTLRETFGQAPAARYSFGAACAAIVLALGFMLLQPEQTRQPVVASELSAQDLAFVQQSAKKHESYVKSAPVSGDVSSLETGAETDEGEDVNP